MPLAAPNFGRVKPPVGARLTLGHPLARGLAGAWCYLEGAGSPHPSLPGPAVTTVGTLGWGVAGPLLGRNCAAANQGGSNYEILPLSSPVGAPFSLTGQFCVRSVQSASPHISALLNSDLGGTGISDAILLRLGDSSLDPHVLEFGVAGASLASIFSATVGVPFIVTLVATPTGGTLYVNGQAAGSHAGTVSGTLSKLYLFTDDSGRSPDGAADMVLLHGRALAPAEVAALHAAPYQLFAAPRPALAAATSFVAAGGTAWGSPLTGETFGLSDARVFAAAKPLAAETLSLSDARALGLLRALSESYALADAHASGIGKGLGDALSLADARALATVRTLTDPLALSDARRLSVARFLGDALALADAANAALNAGGVTLSRSLSETLGLSDARSLAAVRLLAEALGLSDARALAVARSLAESLGVVCHADVGATALIALIAVLSVAADDPVTTGGGLD